jgi:hypothetical protein
MVESQYQATIGKKKERKEGGLPRIAQKVCISIAYISNPTNLLLVMQYLSNVNL